MTCSLLLTGSLTDNVNSWLTHITYVIMYYILYFYNKASQRKENVFKQIIKGKNIYSTVLYIYSNTVSLWFVFKMNHLSLPIAILSSMIQNTVDVTCITNTRHQIWKDNVKTKFMFHEQ